MAFTRGTNVLATAAAAGLTLNTASFSLTAGNWLWVVVSWAAVNSTPSVSDTAGNRFIPLSLAIDTTRNQFVGLFYVPSALGNASNVVTVNYGSASATFRSVLVMPYSYSNAAQIVEVVAPALGGSNTTVTTNSFTAGNLAVAGASEFTGTTSTPGTGWTEQADASTQGFHVEDRIDAPGGTITGDFTLAAAAFWAAVAASAQDGLPLITVQPEQQTVASGATATFSVTATGATSYQWQVNSAGTWANVSTGTGGTTSSYTTGTLGTSDIGNLYRCQVTNSTGTINTAEVFVFLTNQSSAGKGARGFGSRWSQKSSGKFGNIKTNGPASILARARRGPNEDNNDLVTAWFNWFIPQPASTNPTGTLSVTLSNDTLSSSGSTTVTGTLSRTISGDTLSANGTTTILGTLSRTLSNDTLAASGSVGSPVTGTVAVTLGNDTLSSSGTTIIVGTLSRTLSNDTLSSQGTTTVLGTLAKTLLDDTLAAAGSIGSAVSGTLNVTLNSDTLAGQGTTTVIGSLSRTLSNDMMTGSGSVTVTGTLSVTLQNDTLTASGSSGTPVTGVATKLPMTGVGS